MSKAPEYWNQLMKYNRYSKNKNTFEGDTKNESILDQCKNLSRLLSDEDKTTLAKYLTFINNQP